MGVGILAPIPANILGSGPFNKWFVPHGPVLVKAAFL